MYLTPVIAAAILAQAVFASPVPSSLSEAATTTRVPADNGLSLTAKLSLADTAANRFALLPDDKQFVFDFNQKQANAGKGGELVIAMRKNFPALRVGACGMNTLHVHLRGTELQTLVKGRLVTEMVPESGVNDAQGRQRVIRTKALHHDAIPKSIALGVEERLIKCNIPKSK
ncbi:spherulin-1B [Magnaporthiopsis poae ATCC 64411]|uniref:Spherulin-1B n=1 Tax=Magnaporthiopsis poae (strain ATCC 64411 / 73-15) TaxID=644358 RepID=A0A0C4DPI2_MAGP6|nr:spherulin-1B [Magnaporthiopsis poae ATCC 64411]